MAKKLELKIGNLSKEEFSPFYAVEGESVFRNSHSLGRKPVGWYSKDNLRVAFYYMPSWFNKQKMYWLHGWSWENNNE